MQQLLGGLKASDDSHDEPSHSGADDDSEDEDYRRIMTRRVSMNEQNVIGTNFEKYNREAKPTSEIRRKIGNFVMEYNDTHDSANAKQTFLEICEKSSIPHFTFVGYILNHAFSFD